MPDQTPNSLVFIAEVERQIEAAHHNGPEDSKCHGNHGHSWEVTVQFQYQLEDLNEYGWGIDFLEVKKLIDRYDHKDLNETISPPSAEMLAYQIWQDFETFFQRSPLAVSVEEGRGNTVTLTSTEPGTVTLIG